MSSFTIGSISDTWEMLEDRSAEIGQALLRPREHVGSLFPISLQGYGYIPTSAIFNNSQDFSDKQFFYAASTILSGHPNCRRTSEEVPEHQTIAFQVSDDRLNAVSSVLLIQVGFTGANMIKHTSVTPTSQGIRASATCSWSKPLKPTAWNPRFIFSMCWSESLKLTRWKSWKHCCHGTWI